MALYPAISESVVERFGRGFQPQLVALYVATLVGLFIVDAWARDRKLEQARRATGQARAQADIQRLRAEELHLVQSIAMELDAEDRIESSLLRVLERLRERTPFEVGYVFLRDSVSATLVRRGICPLTATPSPAAHELAERALGGVEYADLCLVFSDPEFPDMQCCPIVTGGEAIGVIVLQGTQPLIAHHHARLLTIADRLGAALNGRRLLSELENKERALRHAYRELRLSGSRLARARAFEEAAAVGQAASAAIERPVADALEAVRRMSRTTGIGEEHASIRDGLERVRKSLDEIGQCCSELRGLGRRRGEPKTQQVNDAVVAVLDLALPDLKRAGIEIRLSLERDLPEIVMDEGVLDRLLTRLLRRARAALHRAPAPRRLTIQTRAYGEGVKLTFTDNSAGVSSGGVEQVVRRSDPGSRASPFRRALRSSEREILRGDPQTHGISIETEEQIGEGRTVTVRLRGVPGAVRAD